MNNCHLLTQASTEDKAQLAAIMASVDGDEERYDEFLAFLNEEFSNYYPLVRFYVVAEYEGIIVGLVRIWHSPHIDEWVNDGIVVLPTYRRHGIGSALLTEALRMAAERGADSMIAHIRNENVASMRLHERLGFKRETTCYRNSHGYDRSGFGWQYRIKLIST